MNKITITPIDILDSEWYGRLADLLHIAEKKGLPVKYKNVFDVNSIDIDWDKVEYVQYWVEPSTNDIVYYWKEKE
jgi:hypothetical protein